MGLHRWREWHVNCLHVAAVTCITEAHLADHVNISDEALQETRLSWRLVEEELNFVTFLFLVFHHCHLEFPFLGHFLLNVLRIK
jgi:hypothetical protein